MKGALLLLLLTIAASLVAEGVLLALERIGVDPTHPGTQALATLASISPVVAYGVRRSAAPPGDVLPLRAVPLALLAPMAVAMMGLGILLSEADNLVRLMLPPPDWLEQMFDDLTLGRRSVWGSVALLVVAAPLTEETLFRGVILHGFQRRYAARRAILTSALLFAAFHMNPWQFLGAATAGIVFGWWRTATGSLVPGLVCHALNNAMPLAVATLFGWRIRGYTGGSSGVVALQPLWFDALGIVLTAGGLWVVARRLRHGKGVSGREVLP
jgi:membrane protease YdiL (CAAX protease family)